ncbi:MAG: hypothetical protein PVJ43_09320, partial [Gemmatimonadales bacterium]
SSSLYFIDDSARYIVRSDPTPVRVNVAAPKDGTDDNAKPKETSHPRQSAPLITWILLLALAELMAVLILS